jgi:hypothetical protein
MLQSAETVGEDEGQQQAPKLGAAFQSNPQRINEMNGIIPATSSGFSADEVVRSSHYACVVGDRRSPSLSLNGGTKAGRWYIHLAVRGVDKLIVSRQRSVSRAALLMRNCAH